MKIILLIFGFVMFILGIILNSVTSFNEIIITLQGALSYLWIVGLGFMVVGFLLK